MISIGRMMKQAWTRWLPVAVFGVAGCKTHILPQPADRIDAIPERIPPELETRPHDPIMPTMPEAGAAPATVIDASKQLRKISLKECMAIAIDGGNLGSLGLNGTDNLNLTSFTGRGVTGTDTMRSFIMDPAIAAAEVERSLSKFDARWVTSLSWQKQDQATLSLQQSFTNGDAAQLQSVLAKPLPTGGMSAIVFTTNYQSLSTPPADPRFVTLNTSYSPRLQFIFEQPLLQGFGVEAMQLLNSHPGSVLIPGLRASGGTGTEGILITRIRRAQSETQFNTQVNQMLLNVEIAYWNLMAAYYNLYAQEEGLKGAFRYYKLIEARKDVDIPTLLPQAKAQYWLFRQQVIQARGQVLSADRNLRGILGMKSNDGTIFVPDDQPAIVRAVGDSNQKFQQYYAEALQKRPELLLARQEVKAQQLNLLAQRNLRRADARFFASYDINSIGAALSGPEIDDQGRPFNALRQLQNNQFNSWQVGFRVDVPLGFRDANALVRQQQLSLWKSFEQLRDAERKTHENLVEAIRAMDQAWALLEVARSRRVALEEQYTRIRERIEGGAWRGTEEQNFFIIALRDLASATADEYRAVANYNTALAQIEYAKGTIQEYNNITVSEGPLPSFVQKKAVDHFRASQKAWKLREHPAELPFPGLDQYQPMPMDGITVDPTTNGGLPPSIQPLPSPSQPGQPMRMPGPDVRGPQQPGGINPTSWLKDSAAPSTIKPWTQWDSSPGRTATSTIGGLPAELTRVSPIDPQK